MAKFYGKVGFVILQETAPDVYKEIASEKAYSGDIIRNIFRNVTSSLSVNDNLIINNQIKLIADPFLNTHYPSIKYVNWKGTNWKVTSVDDSNYPNLVLSLGEVYNGKTPEVE